jgi:hypothetical protein
MKYILRLPSGTKRDIISSQDKIDKFISSCVCGNKGKSFNVLNSAKF